MAIPKYDELMPSVLAYLAKHGAQNWRSLEPPLATEYGLTEDEVAQEYDSGNGTIFLDRISWALSYLSLVSLVERPKRGAYQITDLGKNYLTDSDNLKQFVKTKLAEREAAKRAAKQETLEVSLEDDSHSDVTPHEALNAAFDNIRSLACDAILDTILTKTPTEFEKLVVKLLDRMGYGGQIKDAGQVTQATNDGGIDGIIKEDVLGLGRIHIQAKRYARENTVGREEIQKFVGALAVAQSKKGVFITTSSYSQGAKTYVQSLNSSASIVLIDGVKLAEYIYDYSLGMQTEQVVEVKRLDADFWDAMQDA